MKFKITFLEIGREKFSDEIIKEFDDQEDAFDFAYSETLKHLMSKHSTELSQSSTDPELFNVFAGMHTVGSVIIRKVEAMK
jgi:hypothetical protein